MFVFMLLSFYVVIHQGFCIDEKRQKVKETDLFSPKGDSG